MCECVCVCTWAGGFFVVACVGCFIGYALDLAEFKVYTGYVGYTGPEF